MRLIFAALRAARRFADRLWLAVRFWWRLNYSWHVAWIKAER